MADRYWVPGATSWNSTSSWSATLGGASGASVPTSADNVFFGNNLSYPLYITPAGTSDLVCADFTFDGNTSDTGSLSLTFTSLTISGTFSTSNTAGNRRLVLSGTTNAFNYMPQVSNVSIAAVGTVSDVDFERVRLTGAVTSLSGTRIGVLGSTYGIVPDAPKTVYYVGGTGNWAGNQWAASSGGTANTDYFPLGQDTAVIDDNSGSSGMVITMNEDIVYLGSFDASARTSAFTFDCTVGGLGSSGFFARFAGNWTMNSNATLTSSSGTTVFYYVGSGTSTLTSGGASFFPSRPLYVARGTLQLGDAFSSTSTLGVAGGTFDTQGYNVTVERLLANSSFPSALYLRSSTVTIGNSGLTLAARYSTTKGLTASGAALTFDAGTSHIVFNGTSAVTFINDGWTFYNVTFAGAHASGVAINITGQYLTFNNLSFSGYVNPGFVLVYLTYDITVNGTLTVNGGSAVSRYFVAPATVGGTTATVTITAGTLVSSDADFKLVTLAGTAAGSSPTRAGDCGGNTGITFPAPKTVYWNLAGTQTWGATGWATSSGGTPAINNFPLAQDTAVFDNTGSAGTVTVDAYFNTGTVDMSARTTAMTFAIDTAGTLYVRKDWTLGTGVTTSDSTAPLVLGPYSVCNVTSNGVTHNFRIVIQCPGATTQLADALTLGSTKTLALTAGTFDAVSYNVTTGTHSNNSASNTRTLKMGSGTWSLTGTGAVWFQSTTVGLTHIPGTADITLTDTSTTARTFGGGGLSYNKLTIGGTTGTSTLTITGNNTFKELASTKTVAHTIALGSTIQTFGAWTVTGTVGNVVTLTGTGTSHVLAGPCTSGINYLAMGSVGFSATASAGEFYAGANSTGTAAAPVYRTAKPADSVRYWRGGTGSWSSTTYWSTTSGGAGGASVPRSHDDVIFDSASSATSYTATVNTVTGGIRCKSLTISGPASGTLTFAGSTAIVGIHGNVTLPATGFTRTYTGAITLSGNSSGLTFTTNGVTLASNITVNGIGSEWVLGSALNMGTSTITLTNGSLDLATYNLTAGGIASSANSPRTLDLGSGTTTLSGTAPLNIANGGLIAGTMTLVPGTSQLNLTSTSPTLSLPGFTLYNVSFTATAAGNTATISAATTFNDLSFAGATITSGIKSVSIGGDLTVNGTLTLSAGTNATMRTFLRSSDLGTTRTLTCAAVASLQDIDFRDITIAGAAAPVSGTRLGDGKGNSGITFDAPKTVYWNLAGNNFWSATGWATTGGGTPDVNNFPLAQDTAVFQSTSPASGSTITVNSLYNIGTIDMSDRTSNTLALDTTTNSPTIYGNWINGTGTTLSGTNPLTFAGRGSQGITSAGVTFPQRIVIDSPGGTVSLQDALSLSRVDSSTSGGSLMLYSGTFNTNSYNVSSPSGTINFTGSTGGNRAVTAGTTTWTLGANIALYAGLVSTGRTFTYTGSGVFSLNRTANIVIYGGEFPNMTVDVANSGTVYLYGSAGSNTGGAVYLDITNTYSAVGPTAISTTTGASSSSVTRLTKFSAAGSTSGNLSITANPSTTYPGAFVLENEGPVSTDRLTLTNMGLFPNSAWYIGDLSSTNSSYGFILGSPAPLSGGNFFLLFM